MTDIAVRNAPMTADTLRYVAPPQLGVGVDLVRWVEQLKAAEQIATQLCNTDFVPAHFRNNPAAATAAVLYGAGLGMDPLSAWQAIYVIHGRVGMYAKSMVAVLQSVGHKVWVESQSDKSVTVCALRRDGDPKTETNRSTWDVPRAMAAGLFGNSKYKTNTQQMLYARAASEVCRQTAADALHGMPYSVEELEDMTPVSVAAHVGAPVTAAELTAGPVDSPEVPADSPPVAGVTEEQHRAMHVMWRELRFGGDANRAGRLTIMSNIVRRKLESSKDLTEAEARQVIGELRAKIADSKIRPSREVAEALGDVPGPDPELAPEDVSQDDGGWPDVATVGGA